MEVLKVRSLDDLSELGCSLLHRLDFLYGLIELQHSVGEDVTNTMKKYYKAKLLWHDLIAGYIDKKYITPNALELIDHYECCINNNSIPLKREIIELCACYYTAYVEYGEVIL